MPVDCCDNACEVCTTCQPPPSPPPFPPSNCGADELELTILLSLTNEPYPEDISWEVKQVNSVTGFLETLASGGSSGGILCVSQTLSGAPYYIIIRDSEAGNYAFSGNIVLSAGEAQVDAVAIDVFVFPFFDQVIWALEVSAELVATFTEEEFEPYDSDCLGSPYAPFFQMWAQDEICDDGQSGAADVLVNEETGVAGLVFDCPKFNDDGGACFVQYKPVTLPEPLIAFPLNENAGNLVFPSNGTELVGISGSLQNTKWIEDPLFGVALECDKDALSVVKIQGFDYGDGSFSLSFLFRHDSAEGSNHEYVFSHGFASPTVFAPNNLVGKT